MKSFFPTILATIGSAVPENGEHIPESEPREAKVSLARLPGGVTALGQKLNFVANRDSPGVLAVLLITLGEPLPIVAPGGPRIWINGGRLSH
jgi:hypothetical protein